MARETDDRLWLQVVTEELTSSNPQLSRIVAPRGVDVAFVCQALAEQAGVRRLKRNDDLGHDLNDLQIDLIIRAVELTAPDDQKLVWRCLLASDTLLERYQTRTGNRSDMTRAVDFADRVTGVIREGDQDFSDYLLIFGRAYLAAHEANINPSALETAIGKLDSHPNVVNIHPELLQLHGTLLAQRFRNSDDLRDLQRSIDQARAVQRLHNVATDTKIYALSILAGSLQDLLYSGIRGEDVDLSDTVRMGEEATRLARRPECTISDISFVYGALAYALYHRYLHNGSLHDLEKSLENAEVALERSKNDVAETARWLNLKGNIVLAQFRRSTKASLLEKATSSFEEAIKLSLPGSTVHLFGVSNMANALGLRFEWTGETEALDIAVSRYRELAHLENPNATRWADYLRNLGDILIIAHGRHLSSDLLDEAVVALDLALKKYPKGHREVPAIRSLLCRAMTIRYSFLKPRERNESDITLAIDHGKKSLDIAAENDPYLPTLLYTLSLAYGIKWREGGGTDKEVLSAAVRHSERCIRVIPENALERADYLVLHGQLLIEEIYSTNPKPDPSSDFTEPLHLFKLAVDLPNGRPLKRILAARGAIRTLKEMGRWEEAVPIGLAAMRLLPLVCGRHLSLQDQQQAISKTSGLASEIFSLLLQVGKLEEALQQFEAGKAMLLGFAMDNSDEISALAKTHKNLATEFARIKAKLRLPSPQPGSRFGESNLRDRRVAEDDLIKCLLAIRQKEGFHDFLLGPGIDHIRSCSKHGPVVIVNISYIRSDAIILVGSDIRLVPLPNLQVEKAVDFGIQLIAGFSPVDFLVQRSYEVLFTKVPETPKAPSSGFLGWLWDSCVRPIFDELGSCDSTPANGSLPRIWWIGSGGAAGFPFHAAASEYEQGQDALSRSISTYTPSIKILLHARQRSARFQTLRNKSKHEKVSSTIITMETTPGGYETLPAVLKEMEAVADIVQKKWNFTHLPQPTASLALQAITNIDVIHFACHGAVNRGDPSQNHLVLEKPTKKGSAVEIDPLTVSHLLALEDLQKAWIAVLSACTTASMNTFRLADEGLHISGALQTAGFIHVVGSLWKVEDQVGVDIARVFYKNLIDGEVGSFSDRSVAAALREAVIHVRNRNPSSWTKWAAYIHSGS